MVPKRFPYSKYAIHQVHKSQELSLASKGGNQNMAPWATTSFCRQSLAPCIFLAEDIQSQNHLKSRCHFQRVFTLGMEGKKRGKKGVGTMILETNK